MRRGTSWRWAAVASVIGGAAPACDSTAPDPTIDFTLPPGSEWATADDPPPTPVGDLVLVTNNYEDSVSYIDLGLDPPAEIARMPVGLNPVEREGPHHIAIGPNGTAWFGLSNFVPGSGSGPHGSHGTGTSDGYAVELRIADGAQIGSVRVSHNPGDIRVTPDQKRVLVTHFDLLKITTATPDTPEADIDSSLAIVDIATMKREALVTTCPAMHGMSIAPDSSRVTIACWDDRIAVVDLVRADHPITFVQATPLPGTLASPECQPYALTASPDGNTIWVGCFANGDFRAYDAKAGVMDDARHVDLGGSAMFGSYLDEHHIAVAAQNPDSVTWIDADTATVEDVLAIEPADCQLPHVVRPTRDGKSLLLVCEGNRTDPGTFLIIDATTHRVTHVLAIGRFPDDIAIVPKVAP